MTQKSRQVMAVPGRVVVGKRPFPTVSSPSQIPTNRLTDQPGALYHPTMAALRQTAVLHMQRTVGNACVGHALHTTAVQRRRGSPAAEPPERTVAEQVMNQLQARGGITVAVYVYRTARAASEFQRQASQYAEDHQALGISGGRVRPGAAMEIETGVSDNLRALQLGIQALLLRHPDLTGYQSIPIPIRTLAIFTHGGQTQLQAGPHAAWVRRSLEPWVESIAPYLAPSPRVLLFACSVSGDPPRGLPFSEALREMLQDALEQQYGPGTEVAPEVWGHTRPGHTTANALLRGFSGGPVSSAGEDLLVISRDRLTRLAIERSGRATALTERQQTQIEALAWRSMRKVWRAETGRQAPTNVFIREIPQMGIDRVWRMISTPMTPNVSDLGLTPEAATRLVEGLYVFQERFTDELDRLTNRVRSLR